MSKRSEKLFCGLRQLAIVASFILLCWVIWHLTMVPEETPMTPVESAAPASTNWFEDDGTNDADTINPRLPDSEMFK